MTINDGISKWIQCQFPSAEKQAKDNELRPKLLDALSRFGQSRYELGELLAEYQTMFKGSFLGLVAATGLKRSTAYDIIADYKRVSRVPQPVREMARARGIDIAEKKYAELVTQLEQCSVDDAEVAFDEAEAAIKADEAKKENDRAVAKLERTTKRPMVSVKVSEMPDEVKTLEAKVKATIGDALFIARYMAWLKREEAALLEEAA